MTTKDEEIARRAALSPLERAYEDHRQAAGCGCCADGDFDETLAAYVRLVIDDTVAAMKEKSK